MHYEVIKEGILSMPDGTTKRVRIGEKLFASNEKDENRFDTYAAGYIGILRRVDAPQEKVVASKKEEKPEPEKPSKDKAVTTQADADTPKGPSAGEEESKEEDSLPKDKDGLKSLSVEDLRDLAEELGLKSTGTKTTLIKRLAKELNIQI